MTLETIVLAVLIAGFNGIGYTSNLQPYVHIDRAVSLAERAVHDEPPFAAVLAREHSGRVVWVVRTTNGSLYPIIRRMHEVRIDARSGAIISTTVKKNVASEPVPPNPVPPTLRPGATPTSAPHPIGAPILRRYGVARPSLPPNAAEPVSTFRSAFFEVLTLADSPHSPFKPIYMVEAKLQPYGVAQRDLHTGVIAFDIDNARMYVVETLLVPHPYRAQHSVPPGAKVCQSAYGVFHWSQDAVTAAPGFGEEFGPCKR